ncbi:hypothetical protein QQZ08_007551 [Neonectria magnoliae]|uniref:SRR1-like domain-containing protein n=1 Tax=Neonectria magnoliae TaxID=2732573 RepID=A0ABR1HYC5_9HYPO
MGDTINTTQSLFSMVEGDGPRPRGSGLSKEAKDRAVKHVWDLYNSGVPLFSLAQLKDVDDQISSHPESVTITGINGAPYVYETITPANKDDGKPSHVYAEFNSIQRLTNSGEPYVLPHMVYSPISILATTFRSKAVGDVEDVRAIFTKHWKAWESSETCRLLEATLASATLPKSITKIVCFALGPLARLDWEPRRSHTQHAAALTLARILKSRTGHDVQCYSQEPLYTDACRQILNDNGIIVLDGVKGFIELDSSTLVFTVRAGVPVKQITADVAKPAVMIWATVSSPEQESTVWTEEPYGTEGATTWVSPYVSDPDSPRVRNMIEREYTHHPFPKDSKHFGDLGIYVRNQ